ncbi:MAG: hypothetical protein MHM6MM_005184, partial [Cercozoa sp. M6MM]
GPSADLTYKTKTIGESLDTLQQVVQGEHRYSAVFRRAERPIGASALLSQLREVNPRAQVCVLHKDASTVAALDVGFVPGVNSAPLSKAKTVVLLGCDDEKTLAQLPADATVVYIGSHGDAGAARADVVLPAAAYTEKAGTYVNTAGRVQRTAPATTSPGEVRADWSILRALSEFCDCDTLPYDSAEQVHERLAEVSPAFAQYDSVQTVSVKTPVQEDTVDLQKPLQPSMSNYWLSNAIARASKVMAQSSQELPTAANSYTPQ